MTSASTCRYFTLASVVLSYDLDTLLYLRKKKSSTENSARGNNVKMVGEQNIRVQKKNLSSESCSITAYCRIDSRHCTNWLFLISGDKSKRFSGTSLTGC